MWGQQQSSLHWWPRSLLIYAYLHFKGTHAHTSKHSWICGYEHGFNTDAGGTERQTHQNEHMSMCSAKCCCMEASLCCVICAFILSPDCIYTSICPLNGQESYLQWSKQILHSVLQKWHHPHATFYRKMKSRFNDFKEVCQPLQEQNRKTHCSAGSLSPESCWCCVSAPCAARNTTLKCYRENCLFPLFFIQIPSSLSSWCIFMEKHCITSKALQHTMWHCGSFDLRCCMQNDIPFII